MVSACFFLLLFSITGMRNVDLPLAFITSIIVLKLCCRMAFRQSTDAYCDLVLCCPTCLIEAEHPPLKYWMWLICLTQYRLLLTPLNQSN